MYYYSANEKAYRVLDPESNTWSSQPHKPTDEQISVIKAKLLEVKGTEEPETQKDPAAAG